MHYPIAIIYSILKTLNVRLTFITQKGRQQPSLIQRIELLNATRRIDEYNTLCCQIEHVVLPSTTRCIAAAK